MNNQKKSPGRPFTSSHPISKFIGFKVSEIEDQNIRLVSEKLGYEHLSHFVKECVLKKVSRTLKE